MPENDRCAVPETQVSFERREFLKIGAATVGSAAAGASLGAGAARAADGGPLPQNPRTPATMPTRNLGRTGYRVGIFSLGGQAAVEQPDNEAVAVADRRAGARPRRELRRHGRALRRRRSAGASATSAR